ncbi:MAG TPA: hypothetical protein VEK55_12225 [Xanthobacteraceae bacterium]|nr:hypothetical protein [Xanthobacteraceae bacterium]
MKIPRATLVALIVLSATPCLAQDGPAVRHHVRPRIEVTPGYRFYRECVDGYRLVPRPAWGETVLMPFMHCRWVRG